MDKKRLEEHKRKLKEIEEETRKELNDLYYGVGIEFIRLLDTWTALHLN